MKAIMNTERSTEPVLSSGQTPPCLSASSLIITSMARECTCGATAVNLRAIGRTTRCMDKERSRGVTAANTWVSTWMTRRTDTASSSGLMEGLTRETGRMASNTATACT